VTQEKLAELLGVSFTSINRWENGQTKPSALAWRMIVEAEEFGPQAFGDRSAIRESHQARLQAGRFGQPPILDFSSPAKVVRVLAEGERLAQGHLFNPTFATETSLIDALPHQRTAVYDHMLPQPRLRFLLADDAGAGKTIMSGLYIREMLARHLVRRVLIIPPAGLVGNWKREMRTLFNLPFEIITGPDARNRNPFSGKQGDLLIISLDTLAGDRAFSRLQDRETEPYDLVIFDEAHKLSADREADFRIRRTDRYRLAESIAGVTSNDERWTLPWTAPHLLLLTATPHMGKDFPYYCLWRLLEPEVLSTLDAFNAFPAELRSRHFIRRTKEEMIRFDGTRIYPTRQSDTLSYGLSPGPEGEQTLYDETTEYIRTFYNRARLLNRSAARLAMSVFQRRLASSTFALMRSFDRRSEKLTGLIDSIYSGRITVEQLQQQQRRLDEVEDPLDGKTGEEEEAEGDLEENEIAEDDLLGGVVAVNLAELEAERQQVERLRDLAKRVYERGEESKFEKLREFLQEPQYREEKIIVFTEHRDTLEFLVRRLEGIGFTGRIARIHGGMDYVKREEEVEFFRKARTDGGANFLIATDAAGEGINLQFCWLMVNYDIPWNPARLEQRMGRIHRYKQTHDPVVIVNLVAGSTREGYVLKTILDKLERIRKELGSDKVFDVIGRLFEGVSMADYMAQTLTADGESRIEKEVESRLTKELVESLDAEERSIYGSAADVRAKLPDQKAQLEHEDYRRLLPGYVRRFIENGAPLLDLAIEGDLDGCFSLRPMKAGALDTIWPILETYPEAARSRLTVHKPRGSEEAIFLRPGEPVFDGLRELIVVRYAEAARRGAVFSDPHAETPYLFHIARVTIVRQGDPSIFSLRHEVTLEQRLVGLRQTEGGDLEECPVEHLLLLLEGRGIPPSGDRLLKSAETSRENARAYAMEHTARILTEDHRAALVEALSSRVEFLRRGYDYQDAELAEARNRWNDRAASGDPEARGELGRIKARQRDLAASRDGAIKAMQREPALVAPLEVEFIAHALVAPSADPEVRKRHDEEVERIAMQVAWAAEEAERAVVRDVSKPHLARAAGMSEYPGFDLHSRRPDGEERAIEVKGRALVGDVELSENEWAKAINLRDRYWLFVVYQCASANPRLVRVRDPFGRLFASARGGVIIDEHQILKVAVERTT